MTIRNLSQTSSSPSSQLNPPPPPPNSPDPLFIYSDNDSFDSSNLSSPKISTFAPKPFQESAIQSLLINNGVDFSSVNPKEIKNPDIDTVNLEILNEISKQHAKDFSPENQYYVFKLSSRPLTLPETLQAMSLQGTIEIEVIQLKPGENNSIFTLTQTQKATINPPKLLELFKPEELPENHFESLQHWWLHSK